MTGHRAEEMAHLWVASCGPGFPCGTHSSWQHCPHTQVPINSCCCTDLRPELTTPYQKVLLKQPCVSTWGTVTFILDCLPEHRVRALGLLNVLFASSLSESWSPPASDSEYIPFLSGFFNSLVWGLDYKSIWLKCTSWPWVASQLFVCLFLHLLLSDSVYQTMHRWISIWGPLKCGPWRAHLTQG